MEYVHIAGPFGLFFGIVFVVQVLRYARRRARLRKAFRRNKRVRIADVVEGQMVRIVGTIAPLHRPLEAPVTGRPCVGWTAVVDQVGQQRGGGGLLVEKQRCQELLVEDVSGRARVPAVPTELLLVEDGRITTGAFKEPDPRIERFLQSHGYSTKGFLTNRQYRFSEGVLEPGERIAVIGVGTWEPDPDGASRGQGLREAPRRLFIRPGESGKILLSDEPASRRIKD